ncbi:hypothetical protein BLOT_007217 [Blomia tropicalis]|nr:hypothetical protein BLOT_007217 [Blomia tropicalis]
MSSKQVNQKSIVLTHEQNQIIFSLLDTRSYSLSTAVVQLLIALEQNNNNESQWCSQCTGVICLIKDYETRSYFMKIYDFDRKLLYTIFISDLHNYQQLEPQFHIFYIESQVYGLNFTSSFEANHFAKTVQSIISRKSVRLKLNTKIVTEQFLRIAAPSTSAIQLRPEISYPTNFRHLQHVTWNPMKTKFEITSPDINNSINKVLCSSVSTSAPAKPPRTSLVRQTNETNNCKTTLRKDSNVSKSTDQIATIFDKKIVHKFGAIQQISVKNVQLPTPPPLPNSKPKLKPKPKLKSNSRPRSSSLDVECYFTQNECNTVQITGNRSKSFLHGASNK